VEQLVQRPEDGGLVTGHEQQPGVAGRDRNGRRLALILLLDRLERREEGLLERGLTGSRKDLDDGDACPLEGGGCPSLLADQVTRIGSLESSALGSVTSSKTCSATAMSTPCAACTSAGSSPASWKSRRTFASSRKVTAPRAPREAAPPPAARAAPAPPRP
jgi:hypothetical protein